MRRLKTCQRRKKKAKNQGWRGRMRRKLLNVNEVKFMKMIKNHNRRVLCKKNDIEDFIMVAVLDYFASTIENLDASAYDYIIKHKPYEDRKAWIDYYKDLRCEYVRDNEA